MEGGDIPGTRNEKHLWWQYDYYVEAWQGGKRGSGGMSIGRSLGEEVRELIKSQVTVFCWPSSY